MNCDSPSADTSGITTKEHILPVGSINRPNDHPNRQPSSIPEGSEITLQVGERRFVTHTSTLTEDSPFFKTLLSTKWSQARPDGSYFVDQDGDIFAYILQYLRSGIFPIFYNHTSGHDLNKYLAVQAQARYFGIEELEDWIEQQNYNKAVQIEYQYTNTSAEINNTTFANQFRHSLHSSNTQTEHQSTFYERKAYLCPRGLRVHYDAPKACGRQCKAAQGDNADTYETLGMINLFTVKRTIKLDHKLCLRQNNNSA